MIIIFRHFFSQIANSIVHRSFVNKLIDFFSFDDPLQRLYQSIHHDPCLFSRYAIVVPNWFSTLIDITLLLLPFPHPGFINSSHLHCLQFLAEFTTPILAAHLCWKILPRRYTNYIWLDSIQQQHLLWQCPLHREDSSTWIL